MSKPFVRAAPDRTRRIRYAVQLAFLLLNLWIGVEFYRFVRHYETGGATAWVARPGGIEGWLPIAALMNLKVALVAGDVPARHAAGMFLLIAFLAMSLLLRKSFCGWLCPVGTLSEWLWRAGRDAFGRSFRLPRWADLPLRGLKYLLLAFFLHAVVTMPAMAIRGFLDGPYGLTADVHMLNFFRYLSLTAAVVIGVLVLLSTLVQNFWCRYLCPYGALLGLAALASPLRVRRNADQCIDCAKCAKACPSSLPVDHLVQIRSAECMGCLECVVVCPAEGALQMTAGRGRRVPGWAMAAAIAVIFLGVCGWAKWAGHWDTELPSWVYFRLIPSAREFGHP